MSRNDTVDVGKGNWVLGVIAIVIGLFLWSHFSSHDTPTPTVPGSNTGSSVVGNQNPGAGQGSGASFGEQLQKDNFDRSNDEYFDHCQWSQGCRMQPDAHSGNDDNSITGDGEIDPVDGN